MTNEPPSCGANSKKRSKKLPKPKKKPEGAPTEVERSSGGKKNYYPNSHLPNELTPLSRRTRRTDKNSPHNKSSPVNQSIDTSQP